ncbi:hypothetical protein BOSP111201_07840 [Bordetella sputigena]|uniref:fimbrial protein n=1 Tax=Bordetella sputigena TaxID=1416810 RepID=UPI0039EE0A64
MENQRKSFSIMAMSCAAALVMMAGSAQAADTAMINFSGFVVASTCTYQQTMNIPLPTVLLADVNENGKTAGLKKFDIAFSNCPAGAKVRADFQANPAFVDSSSGLLKNLKENDGGAVFVNVALTDKDGNVIRVGQPRTDAPVVADNAGKATLTYGAEYYGTGSPSLTRPGEVTAAVGFLAEYL